MLSVKPHNRPSVNDILRLPFIRSKALQLFSKPSAGPSLIATESPVLKRLPSAPHAAIRHVAGQQLLAKPKVVSSASAPERLPAVHRAGSGPRGLDDSSVIAPVLLTPANFVERIDSSADESVVSYLLADIDELSDHSSSEIDSPPIVQLLQMLHCALLHLIC
jgi:hypothetical protein